MPPPQQTELHFLDLLEVLSHPLPAGYHLLAIARFLQDFTAPALAEPYLAELGSRMPVVRMPGDIDGINPQELETALQTIEACSAPSTTFGSDAQFREILSHWRRAPPFAYWRVGEYARALQILGVSAETLPSWTPERGQTSVTAVRTRAEGLLTEAARKRHNAAEALLEWIAEPLDPEAVAVPVIERLPGNRNQDLIPRGLLRTVVIRGLGWSGLEGDRVEANTALMEFEGNWASLLSAPFGAARALLAEHGYARAGRAVDLQLVLDRPGAYHEGQSANLALAAMLYCHLLRLVGARDAYALQMGSAITGAIEADGTALAVDDHHLAAKVEAAFFSSWNRLVLPARQLGTAHSTLERLRQHYPHRALELHGVNHLRELFFDRRISDLRRISLPRLVWQKTWRRRRPIAAALLVVLLSALAASWIGPLDRDPVKSVFRGELLIVQNKSGQTLREIPVGLETVKDAHLLAQGPVHREMVNFFDVNGDGKKEVLYIRHPESGTQDPHVLVCLGLDDDEPRWTFTARFPLEFPKKTDIVSDAFRLEEIWTGDADGDGRAEVTLLANHIFFPSILARLDALTGTLQARYLHIGTISDMTMVDLEGDGIVEIVACGTNSALRLASLVVLDPRSIDGVSPTAGAYMVNGIDRARERLYDVIPPTPVGQLYVDQFENNGALALEVEPTARRFYVTVTDIGGTITIGGSTYDPWLFYYFGFDLKPLRVATSTPFDRLARRLWKLGELPALPDTAFLAAAAGNIRTLSGPLQPSDFSRNDDTSASLRAPGSRPGGE